LLIFFFDVEKVRIGTNDIDSRLFTLSGLEDCRKPIWFFHSGLRRGELGDGDMLHVTQYQSAPLSLSSYQSNGYRLEDWPVINLEEI
jgi:hypothetical protein